MIPLENPVQLINAFLTKQYLHMFGQEKTRRVHHYPLFGLDLVAGSPDSSWIDV